MQPSMEPHGIGVAQIFNLPYRGFAIRMPLGICEGTVLTNAMPNAIRRYSRLQICAAEHRSAAHSGPEVSNVLFNKHTGVNR
jgi:hypothetical protein